MPQEIFMLNGYQISDKVGVNIFYHHKNKKQYLNK